MLRPSIKAKRSMAMIVASKNCLENTVVLHNGDRLLNVSPASSFSCLSLDDALCEDALSPSSNLCETIVLQHKEKQARDLGRDHYAWVVRFEQLDELNGRVCAIWQKQRKRIREAEESS